MQTVEVRVLPGQSPPELGTLGESRRKAPTPGEALSLSHLPLVVSLIGFWPFFIGHWVPEFHGFPGGTFLLAQFAPLASKELTSEGAPLVSAQSDRTGLLAAYLLVTALLLPGLARTGYWLARLILVALCYAGVVCALVSIISVLAHGLLATCLLGVVGLVLWIGGASATAWRSIWVDPARLPARPARALWALVPYALITPAPIAVGRWLFARDLQQAALVVRGSGLDLRWSALITPTTVPVYLGGLALGLLVAVTYVGVPPRLPGVRRAAVVAAAVAVSLLLVICAALGASAADRRAREIATGSPAGELGSGCGTFVWAPTPGAPRETVAGTGGSCRRLTHYVGFRAVDTLDLRIRTSPLKAHLPDGSLIPAKLVAARYGGTLVVAGTTRVNEQPDRLFGIGLGDLDLDWTFTCADKRPMTLRFLGSEDKDPTTGRVGSPGVRPAVEAGCSDALLRLEPGTGVEISRTRR